MDCLYGSSVDSVYKILFRDIAMLDGQKQGVRTGKANSFYDFRESFQLRLSKKKIAFKYWPSKARVPLGCLPGSSTASTFLPNRPPSPFWGWRVRSSLPGVPWFLKFQFPKSPLRSLRLGGEFTINRSWKPLPRKTRALNCRFLRTHVDLIPGRPAPRLRQNPAAAMAAAGL
jgi:hypothetical protein